jgi:hypothetical protein
MLECAVMISRGTTTRLAKFLASVFGVTSCNFVFLAVVSQSQPIRVMCGCLAVLQGACAARLFYEVGRRSPQYHSLTAAPKEMA